MALMAATARNPVRGPVRRGSAAGLLWTRTLVVLAALTGLVFMHQLVGGAATGGHDHAAHAVVAGDTAPGAVAAGEVRAVAAGEPKRHCPPRDGDCPVPHGHPGQMCQLTTPGHPAVVAPPPHNATLGGNPTFAPALSPYTAAHDAARGTGCGAPALTELSVWRV
jgi:hypothetical protein